MKERQSQAAWLGVIHQGCFHKEANPPSEDGRHGCTLSQSRLRRNMAIARMKSTFNYVTGTGCQTCACCLR